MQKKLCIFIKGCVFLKKGGKMLLTKGEEMSRVRSRDRHAHAWWRSKKFCLKKVCKSMHCIVICHPELANIVVSWKKIAYAMHTNFFSMITICTVLIMYIWSQWYFFKKYYTALVLHFYKKNTYLFFGLCH